MLQIFTDVSEKTTTFNSIPKKHMGAFWETSGDNGYQKTACHILQDDNIQYNCRNKLKFCIVGFNKAPCYLTYNKECGLNCILSLGVQSCDSREVHVYTLADICYVYLSKYDILG
jgi:hypothetical protein